MRPSTRLGFVRSFPFRPARYRVFHTDGLLFTPSQCVRVGHYARYIKACPGREFRSLGSFRAWIFFLTRGATADNPLWPLLKDVSKIRKKDDCQKRIQKEIEGRQEEYKKERDAWIREDNGKFQSPIETRRNGCSCASYVSARDPRRIIHQFARTEISYEETLLDGLAIGVRQAHWPDKKEELRELLEKLRTRLVCKISSASVRKTRPTWLTRGFQQDDRRRELHEKVVEHQPEEGCLSWQGETPIHNEFVRSWTPPPGASERRGGSPSNSLARARFRPIARRPLL